jgi:hypothetical protein
VKPLQKKRKKSEKKTPTLRFLRNYLGTAGLNINRHIANDPHKAPSTDIEMQAFSTHRVTTSLSMADMLAAQAHMLSNVKGAFPTPAIYNPTVQAPTALS